MGSIATPVALDFEGASLAALVEFGNAGHTEAFRYIMQRCNQRLFRAARAILNDDSEAEDALQDAYISAFSNLESFRGDAAVTTWLTRIVINACYQRIRKRHTTVDLDQAEAAHGDTHILQFPTRFGMEDPAISASRTQVQGLLETAIETLPESFRLVFMLRDVEECSVEETALALGIREETVKTRLHRARKQLRLALSETLEASMVDTFTFLGPRCARLTDAVMHRLNSSAMTPADTGES